MDQYADLLCGELVSVQLHCRHIRLSNKYHRAVKMSILALYYRIGSGKRMLPLIVQPRAVWWVAGVMTAFHVAAFTVSVSHEVTRISLKSDNRLKSLRVHPFHELGTFRACRLDASMVHYLCASLAASMWPQI